MPITDKSRRYGARVAHGLVVVGVGVTLLAACGCNKCGQPPPGFAIQGGAFWDCNKPRLSSKDAADYCASLYQPIEEKIRSAGQGFKIPGLDVTSGKVLLAGAELNLSTTERTKYVELNNITLAMVTQQKASCSAVQMTYSCVVFYNPQDHPEVRQAQNYFNALNAREAIAQTAKALEEKKIGPAEAEKQIRGALDHVPAGLGTPPPVPPGGTPTSGGSNPISSGWTGAVNTLTNRLDVISAAADGQQKKTDSLSAELAAVSTRTREIGKHEALLSALVARVIALEGRLQQTDQQRLAMAACTNGLRQSRELSQKVRREILSALGRPETLQATDPYLPVEVAIDKPGFLPCATTLSAEMQTEVANVTRALQAALRSAPDSRFGATVEGFSDEQPIDRYGANGPECAKHQFSNAVLASDRAAAVASAIKGGLGPDSSSVEIVSMGHDDRHVERGCAQSPNPDKCHARNRRFKVTLTGPALVPVLPRECVDLLGAQSALEAPATSPNT